VDDTPIDWFARDDYPDTTITVVVNEAADPSAAALDGTWRRGDVVWTTHLEAVCGSVTDARTNQAPGG